MSTDFNELDAAEPEFGKAHKLDPALPEAIVGLALAQSLRKQYDEARKTLAPALERTPPVADAWSLLGDIETEQERFDAAETAFGQAIRARAHVTLERAKRALARVRQGKFAEAEADLNALGALSRHPYAQYVTGLSHFRQQRLREAADAFELSLAADPNFAPNRVYLAITRLMLGQQEQALATRSMTKDFGHVATRGDRASPLDGPRLGCQKKRMVNQRTLHTTRFGVPCGGVVR